MQKRAPKSLAYLRHLARSGHFARLGLLLAMGAAPADGQPGVPADPPFDLKGKWSGNFVSGNRDNAHDVDAKIQDTSTDQVTLRLSTGDHGTRDWRLAISGKKLKLLSCVAARSASDTEIKDLRVTGEFATDENGAATSLTCSGDWRFQSKKAGGTEKVKLTLKRAK